MPSSPGPYIAVGTDGKVDPHQYELMQRSSAGGPVQAALEAQPEVYSPDSQSHREFSLTQSKPFFLIQAQSLSTFQEHILRVADLLLGEVF